MRDQHINTFHKGMMKDLGDTIPQEGSYTHAENIKIIAGEEGGSAIVSNIKGNKFKLLFSYSISASVLYEYINDVYVPTPGEIVGTADVAIIGYTIIRDSLIVFGVTESYTEVNTTDTYEYKTGLIYKVNLDTLNKTLIYEDPELNFQAEFPISAIGRYESADIQRVYWTDNLNPVRVINVAESQLNQIPIEELSLRTPANFISPKITDVTSTGSLPAGMYQYTYRLRTIEGAVTRFSPLSNFTHIVNGTVYWDYEKDPENQPEYGANTIPGTITNKGVKISIPVIDEDYDYIDVATIYKTAIGVVDSAYIIKTLKVKAQAVEVEHRTTKGIDILIEEITSLTEIPSKVSTIASKDNRLFMGGLEYSPFNLEFNARAYRFRRKDNVEYPIDRLGITEGTSANDYESYVDFDFDPLTKSGEVNFSVEDNLNAINPYNAYGAEKAPTQDQYKFQKNGIELGGHGPNISYKFIKKRLNGNTIEGPGAKPPFAASKLVNTNCTGGETTDSGDYKSPTNAAEFVGYHRDEIYRFGIVLYDLQGNPGFVNWIGDIRFPDYHDYNHTGDWQGMYNYTLAQIYYNDSKLDWGEGSGTNYNFKEDTKDAYENMEIFYPDGVAGGQYDQVLSSYDTEHEVNSFPETYNTQSRNTLYALGIQFFVHIPEEIQDKVSGYRVVRVERTEADKTVLGSGLVNFFASYGSYGEDADIYNSLGGKASSVDADSKLPYNTMGAVSGNYGNADKGVRTDYLLSIDSPEWPFLQNYPTGGCHYLKIVGGLSGVKESGEIEDDIEAAVYSAHRLANNREDLFKTFPLAYTGKINRGEENFYLNIPSMGSILNLDSPKRYKGFTNKLGIFNNTEGEDEYFQDWEGIGEETLLAVVSLDPDIYEENTTTLSWESYVNIKAGETGNGKILASIKRELGGDQYGGNLQLARSNNSYIPAGPFISIKETDPNLDPAWRTHAVWGGDTYVVMYDLEKVRKFNDTIDAGTSNDKSSVNYVFPVESSVNTTLRGGWHFTNKEDWDIESDTPLNSFELNPCYSSANTTEVYIPKPSNFIEKKKYDHRIVYSEPKISGSHVDGWRKFKLENYKDLDGEHGQLNTLLLHSDNMYFLQDRSFGILSVSPVSTVVDKDGTSIILGTGDIIQDFKYISTSVGARDNNAIATANGIYWVDRKTKKIYRFKSGGLESVSDTKGMKSWATTNIDPSLQQNIQIGNNVQDDEILFSIGDTTLVFSEALNSFTSFYTYTTSLYINTYDNLLSLNAGANSIYTHNIGSYNTWYEEPFKSNIEFTVNKTPTHTKVFDNIEWYSVGGPVNQDLVSSAVFKTSSNDSVTTEFKDIESSDYFPYKKVKEKMTKIPIPRTSANYRFRDTYIKVKLISDAVTKFTLHYVKTLFRISKR